VHNRFCRGNYSSFSTKCSGDSAACVSYARLSAGNDVSDGGAAGGELTLAVASMFSGSTSVRSRPISCTAPPSSGSVSQIMCSMIRLMRRMSYGVDRRQVKIGDMQQHLCVLLHIVLCNTVIRSEDCIAHINTYNTTYDLRPISSDISDGVLCINNITHTLNTKEGGKWFCCSF